MALICIEGIDSSGKNTQAKLLAGAMTNALLLSFPRYNTPLGEAIRAWLKDEMALRSTKVSLAGLGEHTEYPLHPFDPYMFQALMIADKLEAYAQFKSRYEIGQSIVCDRWIPSALCYGAADGVDSNWLGRIHVALPEADVNVLIDLPPEEALKRRPVVRDRNERDRAKQQVVHANYHRLWQEAGKVAPNRYRIVDGVGTIDEVHQRVLEAVGL